MVTLMAATINGKRRRCDATCHNARKPKCRCICSGQHHGGGTLTPQSHHSPTAEAFSDPLPLLDGTIRQEDTLL